MTQSAFTFATESTAPPPAEAPEWLTAQLPDLSGIQSYIVLIRAPDDPERTPRESGSRDMRAEWRRALMKQPVAEIEAAILLHMADGVARTLNRLSVEMIDKTADIIFETPFDAALWSLVSKGVVEFTVGAPVLFRKVGHP